MGSPGPARDQRDLADMVEMLLDKGVVINADIAVSIGDTELLGVQVRAALASFETAAEYGLAFPEGTDMERVEAAAAGRPRRQVDEAAESGESADEEEEAAAATGDEPSDDAGDAAPEAEGPNGVALRPHARTDRSAEDEVEDDVDD